MKRNFLLQKKAKKYRKKGNVEKEVYQSNYNEAIFLLCGTDLYTFL